MTRNNDKYPRCISEWSDVRNFGGADRNNLSIGPIWDTAGMTFMAHFRAHSDRDFLRIAV